MRDPAPVVVAPDALSVLVDALRVRGYRVLGPTVADGAIVYAELDDADELPIGWTDRQDGATYRLPVYPWLGLLRSGIVDEPLHVPESCRTTPALVRSVDRDALTVALRPLAWDGRTLALGPWQERGARWRDGGLALVAPRRGDWVALHWGFACDLLTPAAAASLRRATRRALDAVNRSSSTAAALA